MTPAPDWRTYFPDTPADKFPARKDIVLRQLVEKGAPAETIADFIIRNPEAGQAVGMQPIVEGVVEALDKGQATVLTGTASPETTKETIIKSEKPSEVARESFIYTQYGKMPRLEDEQLTKYYMELAESSGEQFTTSLPRIEAIIGRDPYLFRTYVEAGSGQKGIEAVNKALEKRRVDIGDIEARSLAKTQQLEQQAYQEAMFLPSTDIKQLQDTALNKLSNYKGDEPDSYRVADFIKDNPTREAVTVLSHARFGDEVVNKAREYVDMYEGAWDSLTKDNRALQLYIIAQALGFKERQRLAKLDEPLTGLTPGQRENVTDKYMEMDISPAELRGKSLKLLREELKEAGIIYGLAILTGLTGVGGTVGRVAGIAEKGAFATLGTFSVLNTVKNWNEMSVPEKAFATSISALMFTPVVKPVAKGAYNYAKDIVPSNFRFDAISLETAVPRTQLRGGMTRQDTISLIADVEHAWGGQVPNYLKPVLRKDPITSAMFTDMVKGVDVVIKDARGKVVGRVNPSQMGLDNVLYTVKPDIQTYTSSLSRSGEFITPSGSMEWWSPNASADVMGWYIGKVPKYSPGAKMLRYTKNDFREYPPDLIESTLRKTSKEKWERTKKAVGGDRETAANELIREEVIRRAQLPPGHPEALPLGIYPIFKYHWSHEPSGVLRPTFELEMITPAGFKSSTFTPTRWSSSFNTGTRDIASFNAYSPVEGFDRISGQGVSIGQKIPIIITATDSAIASGKGVPTLSEIYAIKYLYQPVVGVKNLFSPGKLVRPRATEADIATSPREWRSRAIKISKPDEIRYEIQSKQILDSKTTEQKITSIELAEELGETIVNGRITKTRDAYMHPVKEIGDNWVQPRVSAVVKVSDAPKKTYLLFNDTAEPSHIYSLGGGQIDPMGNPILDRPFGSITLEEALQEQFLSEISIPLRNVRPAPIFEGKMTEHSQYGAYMFDADITMSDLSRLRIVPGEVRSVIAWESGTPITLSPSAYVRLAKDGADLSKAVIVDSHLPTANVRSYPIGSINRSILERSKVVTNSRDVVRPKSESIVYESKGQPEVTWEIPKTKYDDEFVLPYKPKQELTLAPIEMSILHDESAIGAESVGIPEQYTDISENMFREFESQLLENMSRQQTVFQIEPYPTVSERVVIKDVEAGEKVVLPVEDEAIKYAYDDYVPSGDEYPVVTEVIKEKTVIPEETESTIYTPEELIYSYDGEETTIPYEEETIIPTRERRKPYLYTPDKGIQETTTKMPGVIAWKQGFVYWVVKEPYATKNDVSVYHEDNLPDWIDPVPGGRDAAMRSLQTITGKPPEQLTIDLGIQDIVITGDRDIRYIPDTEESTIMDIDVEGVKQKTKHYKVSLKDRENAYSDSEIFGSVAKI